MSESARIVTAFFLFFSLQTVSALSPEFLWNTPTVSEPSGICFDSKRKLFYLVGDSGEVARLNPDGIVLQTMTYQNRDFEGITLDEDTDTLLALDESRGIILLLNPETLESSGTVKIPSGGKGSYEGIAWRNDGTVLLVNQIKKRPRDRAGITVLQNLYGEPHSDFIQTGIRDQSGLFYNSPSDEIFIISDTGNRLYRLNGAGTLLDEKELPGEAQEGIAIDHRGIVYIAQDSGGILGLSR